MLRKTFIALTMLSSLAFVGAAALAADPTMHEVYQAAESGDFAKAQAMMDQVLRDHPNSAKAHFVEAELLAKQGKVAQARIELETAERLEPGLPFAKPGAADALRARIATPSREVQPYRPLAAPAEQAFPWGTLLLVGGLIVAVVAVVRMLRRRAGYAQRANAPYYGAQGSAPPFGQAPMGQGPVAPSGGIGSGILGGLATGAAVGAGVVAGEALMHRVLDGGHQSDGSALAAEPDWREPPPSSFDMGGDDFGVQDSSSWDDSSSGGGGDDWN